MPDRPMVRLGEVRVNPAGGSGGGSAAVAGGGGARHGGERPEPAFAALDRP